MVNAAKRHACRCDKLSTCTAVLMVMLTTYCCMPQPDQQPATHVQVCHCNSNGRLACSSGAPPPFCYSLLLLPLQRSLHSNACKPLNPRTSQASPKPGVSPSPPPSCWRPR